jgi:hypothetical protein
MGMENALFFNILAPMGKDEKHSLQRRFEIVKKTHEKNKYIC